MTEEQRSQNKKNIKKILQDFESRMMAELERTGFFTGNLVVTVQNNTIRTRKLSVEDCEHFQLN